MATKAEHLLELPIFAQLSPAQHVLLRHASTEVSFEAHERLLTEGDLTESCWLIRSGYVDLDLPIIGGHRLSVHRVGPGELLGCSWLVPPYRAHFGAITAEPTTATAFDTAELRALAESEPQLGYLLTMALFEALAERLESAKDRIREAHRALHSTGRGANR